MATDRQIWESPEWQKRRKQCREYEEWFTGDALKISTDTRNKKTGKKQSLFPLDLNLVKLACTLHKDVARGIPNADAPLMVTAVVERGDALEKKAQDLERLINDGVWRPSHGGPLQQEALLAMNIYGGTGFKLAWEPWNRRLPYRLAVRAIKNPGYMFPKWDWLDPWQMLECYIGYEISKEAAALKYGVRTDKPQVLYMERWTAQEYSIHVDEQVPVMRATIGDKESEYKLEGNNPFGFVPCYYIPHERTTEQFGDSIVNGQLGLVKEINARMTTLANTIRASNPGLVVGHDLRGKTVIRRVVDPDTGSTVLKIVDIGSTRPVPNSGTPGLDSVPTPDIPESIANFPEELTDYWMMLMRISPASFGLDDTRSGRITGPAVMARMFSGLGHAVTERINFTAVKTDIDSDILAAVVAQGKAYAELDIKVPEVTAQDATAGIKQAWPPMVPLERQEIHREWMDRLGGGGSSIEKYLEAMGEEDTAGERDRILEWMKEVAEIEQATKPQPAEGSSSQ